MLKRTPIFQAIQPQLVGSGLQPDLLGVQKVLWDTAENVSFQNGRIKRLRPKELQFTAGTDPIRGIAQLLDSNGTRWVYAGSGEEVVRWYGPSVEAVHTATAFSLEPSALYNASFWDMIPFGDWIILNNGRDDPAVFKPGTGMDNLGDVPSEVTTMKRLLAFLLAIGYGDGGTRVGWCSADEIDLWTAADDNSAGALTISEFTTPIRAAEYLGSGIAVYAEDQLALVSPVGDPFWFGYKIKLNGIGACGKASVAGDGYVNVGVGRNGVWWTDGVTYRYIDEGAIRDYFQDNVNWDMRSKIVAARNDVTQCYEFCFPMGASTTPNEAWSVDMRNGAWSQVEVFTSKQERALFDRPLLGTNDGKIYKDNTADEGNALSLLTRPIMAQIQSESGLTDVHTGYEVEHLGMLVKTANNVQWRIGSCQESEGDYSWGEWRDVVAGSKTYTVPKGVPTAPFHRLAFRSTELDWDFNLQGFILFGSIEGVKLGVTKS